MPKICYQNFRLQSGSLVIVAQANRILAEYAARGIIVTLRQLYYQFVARDLIANKQSEYKRLGSIVNDARLAGLIDWDYLQDRTRNLSRLSHWESPSGVIESAAAAYHRDLWNGQAKHVEVWIEKDALVGVIESVCEQWDVPYFSCRGYTSQSEMWAAGQRLMGQIRNGKKVRIIHLGDHDPSGRDMSRDITDRLQLFTTHHMIRDYAKLNPRREDEGETSDQFKERMAAELEPEIEQALEINRIALNMDQITRYNPPPNPTKITDSRAGAYIEEFGHESWELDALDPDVLVALIRDNILLHLDLDRWNREKERQEKEREVLQTTSENWTKISAYVLKTFKQNGKA